MEAGGSNEAMRGTQARQSDPRRMLILVLIPVRPTGLKASSEQVLTSVAFVLH